MFLRLEALHIGPAVPATPGKCNQIAKIANLEVSIAPPQPTIPTVPSSERLKVIHLYSAPKVQFLTMVLACSFVLMNPTEIAKYSESQEQWLLSLLSRRQVLAIEMAKLDVEISFVRGILRACKTVKENGVVEGGESSVEDAAPEATV